MALTATLRYEGGPVEKLCMIARERSRLLHQALSKSLAATMQTALQSLRAATRKARRRTKYGIGVEDTGWYCGFDGRTGKPCLRQGPSRGDAQARTHERVVNAVGLTRQETMHVYRVTPENTKIKPYLVVANNAQQAMKYEVRATHGRISRHGSLARNILSLLRGRIHGSTMKESGAGSKAASDSRRLSSLSMTGTSIRITDHAEYATEALKGETVNSALQKAVNRTKSILEHALSTKLGRKVNLNL
jgi:hypothetical protein